MHKKLKTLRLEFSICALSFVNTPEIFAREIVEIIQAVAKFVYPPDGRYRDYNASACRDWLRRLCVALIEHLQRIVDLLDGKALPDKL